MTNPENNQPPKTRVSSTRWYSIGGGAYEERLENAGGKATGRYRARPVIAHRHTWRALKAVTRNAAIREAARADWIAKADSFAQLAEHWETAGYPGRKGIHSPAALAQAKTSLEWLVKYFGKFRADEIRLKHLPDYSKWRSRTIKRGKITGTIKGGRTIDLDLATLSNVLHYGVKQGILEINYIYRARDRFQGKPRHAYYVMPPDAEAIHKISAYFFERVKTEVNGWLNFFSTFTGLRHSELRRLDRHARPGEAGYIHWFTPAEIKERSDGLIGQLHLGHRSKDGINPYSDIFPEFGEMLRAFLHWHRRRFGLGNPNQPHWFFHGRFPAEQIGEKTFAHALRAACKELELPHITPHGCRAYFATKHARDNKRSEEIAFDMGDKTVSLVHGVYVGNLKGPKLWWTPPDGLPAWNKWLPQSNVLARKSAAK